MHEVDGKQRFGRLDDVAHVVNAPHGGDFLNLGFAHFPENLFESLFQFFQRSQLERVAVAHILAVNVGGYLIGFALPDVKDVFLVVRHKLARRPCCRNSDGCR